MLNQVAGSLQEKKGIYYAVLYHQLNGEWKRKWISTKIKAIKGNKKKAELKLDQIKKDFYNTLTNTKDTETTNILFVDFMKDWLKIIKHSIQSTTYMGYSKLINGRMSKYFTQNKLKLVELRPKHIQDFYEYLSEEGLSGNSITRYHANIRKALQYAVKTDLIESNPADKIEKPQKENYIAQFYVAEEIDKLFEVTKGTKIEIPVMFGAYYGLRRSEVVGLKWKAIDFDNKTITIEHVVVDIVTNGKREVIGRDSTKNKSSNRTLPLIPEIEAVLIALREKQKENMKLYKDSYNKKYKEYICVDDLGNLINLDYISHSFVKLLKKHGLKKIRFHDLRHSCASLLLKQGRNIKHIQVWLGHSNYNTTANIYGHLEVTEEMNTNANIMSNILNMNKGNQEEKEKVPVR
ncbi:MAG: site-specific integrase [Oscillospiraceae bacterium]|nr:site-specific integrase [Oscillospiraceae bacterium]